MSAIPLGAKVIANWQPSELDYTRVYDEWLAIINRLCGSKKLIRSMTDVRSPSHMHAAGFTRWHRDHYRCAKQNGCNCEARVYIVVWSNYLPTLVKLSDGSRLRTKAGDVLLLDNDLVLHRTDKRVRAGTTRWFARAMILHGNKD